MTPPTTLTLACMLLAALLLPSGATALAADAPLALRVSSGGTVILDSQETVADLRDAGHRLLDTAAAPLAPPDEPASTTQTHEGTPESAPLAPQHATGGAWPSWAWPATAALVAAAALAAAGAGGAARRAGSRRALMALVALTALADAALLLAAQRHGVDPTPGWLLAHALVWLLLVAAASRLRAPRPCVVARDAASELDLAHAEARAARARRLLAQGQALDAQVRAFRAARERLEAVDRAPAAPQRPEDREPSRS